MRTIGKQSATGMRKQNNRLVILSDSRSGHPKNDNEYYTPPTNHESFDNETVTAIAAVLGPFDAVDALGKRIRKKIRKSRKDVTPGTEAAHHGILADIASKKPTAAMQVLEDCAAGDNSDIENS